MIKRRYAFVCPRFGDGIIGGEVTLIKELTGELKKRGHEIEILTTCAKDNRTWENFYEEGEAEVYGIKVTRFKVDERDLDIWVPKQISISEGMVLPLEDQLAWMQHSVNASGLYEHIAKVADNFDAMFFVPYLFGTTFWGSLVRPDKSFLIPCLHDEGYAYTDVIASMFRQVKGAIFNAPPEQDLANKLYGEIKGGAVGIGFVPPSAEDVAKLKPYFKEDFPYIVYVGRKETGKNAHLLIDYFTAGKDNGTIPAEVKLAIAGGGDFSDLHRDEVLGRGDVLDVGRLEEEEKRSLIKYALALSQPSVNESFSIVLMEAWLLGTPVLVNEHCAVTKYQAKKSEGGFCFSDSEDFASKLSALYNDKALANRMAESGKNYVLKVYNWDAVTERFENVMEQILK